MIVPITLTEPACYGFCGCSKHSQCQRYHAVEGQPVHTILTCETQGKRPLFVPIVAVQGVAA